MVTGTSKTNELRVSFEVNDPAELNQFEIVCIVRMCDEGIEVVYSHHLLRHRSVPSGSWGSEDRARVKLTSALIAQIETGVMLEIWTAFSRKIRVLEAEAIENQWA